jgi:hypothetical protein
MSIKVEHFISNRKEKNESFLKNNCHGYITGLGRLMRNLIRLYPDFKNHLLQYAERVLRI